MPNTALQTKATLTPYPGYRGDQRPFWRAGMIPTCAKNNPTDFTKLCTWAITKSQLLIICFIVVHICLFVMSIWWCTSTIVCEPLCILCFCACSHSSVLLCLVPWGSKQCLSLNLPLFTSAEAICDVNSLYMEIWQRQQPRLEQYLKQSLERASPTF